MVKPTVLSKLSQPDTNVELQKVVDALSIHSVIHGQESHVVDPYGMTWLDADTAYHLLDNPGEPNEALKAILALR